MVKNGDDGDNGENNNDDGDNGDGTDMNSRSLEHFLNVFVLGDGEVDGVEDGAVLVEWPGVDVDEVGDFLPVPPGVEGGLTHHGRGVAEGPTSGGTEQEYYQIPEQDQTNTNQKNGTNSNQIQVWKSVFHTGFDVLNIEASALGVGSDEGSKCSDDGHDGRHGIGCYYPDGVAVAGGAT